MICAASPLLCLLLFGLWFQESPSINRPQSSELLAPIEVQAELARRAEADKVNLVAVTLRNRTAAPVTNLSVPIGSGVSSLIEKKLNALEAGQTWGDRFALPSTESN